MKRLLYDLITFDGWRNSRRVNFFPAGCSKNTIQAVGHRFFTVPT